MRHSEPQDPKPDPNPGPDPKPFGSAGFGPYIMNKFLQPWLQYKSTNCPKPFSLAVPVFPD